MKISQYDTVDRTFFLISPERAGSRHGYSGKPAECYDRHFIDISYILAESTIWRGIVVRRH